MESEKEEPAETYIIMIKLGFQSSLALLLSVVGLAFLPGLAILVVYQHFTFVLPVQWTVAATLFFFVKVCFGTVVALLTVVTYADFVFPKIMRMIESFLSRVRVE
ncbi:unnamed protein product [Bursaphelenchus xylophilus]|uniref:(pine wood nematode) hypothetical protein n=1 Tax=Bursaphelenchus xylophilus TaxID=6326 RepID=A0A7I8X0N4_BURXY|nr:unnamed protein product [Bursaphelenchus xylophilus]CAG9130071.1 unnamed protein product [Bursaphelenchus xylophilus]